ncbi:MAG: thioredoxin domain-containing protein [Ardenticatenaceae bacterium]|nr:thioredoxin domain-containing protein [Ardenticatenaceae bacterium]HBY92659.1 hypothetical protein [Chloroflexota bacterium]
MKQRSFFLVLAGVLSLLLAACGATPTPQVIVVTATPEPATPTSEAAATPGEALADQAGAPSGSETNVNAPAPATPAADLPKPAASEGRIAFMGPYGQNLQIFLINADGSGLTLVTENDPTGSAFPNLSPDGTKVAFVSSRDGNPEIYVQNLGTKSVTRITDAPGMDNQPLFSPDGSKIAFISDRAGSIDIWVGDADGKNQKALTTRDGDELLGGWSPDGKRLLIVTQSPTAQNIWTVDGASGELAQLTDREGIDAAPVYSPDGGRIAFYSNRGGKTLNIFTMAPDGSDVVQLTNGPEDNLFPVYSPDGKWLVYSTARGQTLTLVAMPAGGGAPVFLNPDIEGLPTSWKAATEPLAETGFTQGPQQRNIKVSDEVLASAPSKGDPNAPVTIIEFSDYQCPFCKRFVDETLPEMKPYIEKGQVRFVWVDFPLDIHPQAPAAARAARCASEQGDEEAYWKMHDALFAGQSEWAGQEQPFPVFGDLARQAGLDGDKLVACLESGRYRAEVDAGLKEGADLQISGTPTFFVNGTRLVGAQPFEAFKPLIEEALP